MSCEHLICAACAGPVVEGRCPVCRAGRAEVHRHSGALSTQWMLLIALLVALLTVFALLHPGV